MTDYMDFWFYDDTTGEQFFVELECNPATPRKQAIKALTPKAIEIAKDNFDAPHLLDVISPEEAEILGYDTY